MDQGSGLCSFGAGIHWTGTILSGIVFGLLLWRWMWARKAGINLAHPYVTWIAIRISAVLIFIGIVALVTCRY